MRRAVITIAVTTGVLAVAYFAWDLVRHPRNPCESIFQQTRTSLASTLDVIKAKGQLVIGEERLQELTERSQMLAINLKTCCIVLEGGKLSPEQFLRCKEQVDDYRRKIETVATAVEEVSTAEPARRAERAAEKRPQVEATLTAAAASSTALEAQVGTLSAPAAGGAAATGVAKPTPATGEAKPAAAARQTEREPNNDFASATPVVPGVVSGAVAGNDVDFFRFHHDGTHRDRAHVHLTNPSMTLAPDVTYYDAQKSQLGHRYDTTRGADLDFDFTAEPGQDHYLRVSHFDGEGAYELSLELRNAFDAYEPNDDAFTATRVTPGQVIVANVLDAHDVDWYRITPDGGARVTGRLENRSATLMPDIKIYDRNRAQIEHPYSTTAGASLDFSFPVSAGQEYYLAVGSFSGDAGAYELRLTQ